MVDCDAATDYAVEIGGAALIAAAGRFRITAT
jgi:hypothetical protein